ncbi:MULTISPECIES: hypothetical protein [unclassified Bacillus cereus group]|uniref:hypothetical protein n=1 Tax=unclassified Bacillus cereus group TaxID=2750818 RepID=UPI0011EEE549|nr:MULTISPECIES: hypothetical protein [unclassified Bacillus cereus group]QEL68855.1 hypothetical protein DN399_12590 [Bacillus sp. AR4-2]QEL74132.1 hypothetical protein DN405_12590 [Bacillus sp. SH8-8]
MKQNIKLWSWIFSIICIGLFFLYLEVSPHNMNESIMDTVYFYLLFILLVFTTGAYFLSLIGFSKIKNWKVMVLLILSLFVFLALILFVGYGLILNENI